MIDRSTKIRLLPLFAVTILLAGCLVHPDPAATPGATLVAASPPAPSPTATSVATATPVPQATAAEVPPPPRVTATATPSPSPAQAKGSHQEGFTEGGEPFRGDPNAPVVLEEFSSYQCSFCGDYFQESLPLVMADYVEAGQVLYVFRDFPLPNQPQAQPASEAANCAGQVGEASMYWAMHDLLFARQGEWSKRGIAREMFKGYAAELGLDPAAFARCLDTGTTRVQVKDDFDEGVARGVRGAPTFFINGQALIGAQPYDAFARAIDAALAVKAQPGAALDLAPSTALPSPVREFPLAAGQAYHLVQARTEMP